MDARTSCAARAPAPRSSGCRRFRARPRPSTELHLVPHPLFTVWGRPAPRNPRAAPCPAVPVPPRRPPAPPRAEPMGQRTLRLLDALKVVARVLPLPLGGRLYDLVVAELDTKFSNFKFFNLSSKISVPLSILVVTSRWLVSILLVSTL